jgi:hypothetical protein
MDCASQLGTADSRFGTGDIATDDGQKNGTQITEAREKRLTFRSF